MITTCLRAALAAAFLAPPLTTPSPASAADADADLVTLPMTLKQAVTALPTAAESRDVAQKRVEKKGWATVEPEYSTTLLGAMGQRWRLTEAGAAALKE